MTQHDTHAVVDAYFDAWNRHDLDAIADSVADDYQLESQMYPAPIEGPDGIRQFAEGYITAFPDIHFEVTDQIASGDLVASAWVGTGTHEGDLSGIPPTGRRVEIHGCNITRVRNGKIVQSRIYWDSATLMRQLGVMPGA